MFQNAFAIQSSMKSSHLAERIQELLANLFAGVHRKVAHASLLHVLVKIDGAAVLAIFDDVARKHQPFNDSTIRVSGVQVHGLKYV